MTYITQQTSEELRAHMNKLTAMEGWHEPFAARLWAEIQVQDATIAQQDQELEQANKRMEALEEVIRVCGEII